MKPIINLNHGNQTRKFLKLLPILREELEKESDVVTRKGLPYIETSQALDKVVGTCFGTELLPNYEENIEDFREAYTALKISITHNVIFVFEFIFEWNIFLGAYYLRASGAVSEQC